MRTDLIKSHMTFENFIIGDGNSFAYSAAMSVASNISSLVYNPLFIHSKIGLGKTHLMKAIGNKVLKRNEYLKVFYIDAKQLIEDFATSVNNDLLDEFAKFYNEQDLLLFDNIDVDGFFYVYDWLSPQCQVVMSCRKSPGQMPQLEHRTKKMLSWGLIADMHPVDRITRETILLRMANRLKANIPMNIIYLIASRITNNIAKLEEALQRIIAVASISGGTIDKRTVLKLLKNLGY